MGEFTRGGDRASRDAGSDDSFFVLFFVFSCCCSFGGVPWLGWERVGMVFGAFVVE